MTFENPVFVTYGIAAAIMILKSMGQGWMTVHRMMKVGGGFLNPEDVGKGWANPNPRPGQLDPDDYVERSRRMHRNDTENIPVFLVAGFLFVLTQPSLLIARYCSTATSSPAWATSGPTSPPGHTKRGRPSSPWAR